MNIEHKIIDGQKVVWLKIPGIGAFEFEFATMKLVRELTAEEAA